MQACLLKIYFFRSSLIKITDYVQNVIVYLHLFYHSYHIYCKGANETRDVRIYLKSFIQRCEH